tara:strand:+ start:1758 stop:2087 length:330 start_codon:yes stop_codon:yes gene_type:complete
MKKLLVGALLLTSMANFAADDIETFDFNDGRKTCYAFLKHDPSVVGMVGYKLYVERPDGVVMYINTNRPGTNSGGVSSESGLKRILPGLERDLRKNYVCDHLVYEGIKR